LVRRALRAWSTDRGWKAIVALQLRASPSLLVLVHSLCASPSWRRRALGLYVASQLQRPRRPGDVLGATAYAMEATQTLLLAGLHDPHDEVVCAAVSGLGHRPHPEALTTLVDLAGHADSAVRWDVAVALSCYSEPAAIDALMHLAVDADPEVRDWATFGLGTQQTVDTPQVREVLWRNLNDDDEDVRGEALVGLAARRDLRVIDHLLAQLGSDCRVYQLEAAEQLASPALLPALRAIADGLRDSEREGYWFGQLQSAIDACSPASLPDAQAR
jgi:HEAT repeat protein